MYFNSQNRYTIVLFRAVENLFRSLRDCILSGLPLLLAPWHMPHINAILVQKAGCIQVQVDNTLSWSPPSGQNYNIYRWKKWILGWRGRWSRGPHCELWNWEDGGSAHFDIPFPSAPCGLRICMYHFYAYWYVITHWHSNWCSEARYAGVLMNKKFQPWVGPQDSNPGVPWPPECVWEKGILVKFIKIPTQPSHVTRVRVLRSSLRQPIFNLLENAIEI